ncbi:MAG: hypothetical protein NUV85_01615, partial [Candidatus Berkelbacteria bacterium]|nr:hypothetical protein [Candidatus Berkelbacteria bacterium]
MPTIDGTIRWFDPVRGWGFASIGETQTNAMVHQKQKCRVVWTGPAADDLEFQRDQPCVPKLGDRVVLDPRQRQDGKVKAIAWAFQWEWDAALLASPLAKTVETPPLEPPPVFVPPAPKEEPPLTFGEMLEVLDFRFLHAVLDAVEKEELTPALLQLFVRNPPKKKHGKAVWDEY